MTEFLNAVSLNAQNFMQDLYFTRGAGVANKAIYADGSCRDIEQAISGRLTPEDKERYTNAREFLIHGLDAERFMSSTAEKYFSEPDSINDPQDALAVRETVRDLLIQGVKPSDVPKSFTLAIQMNMAPDKDKTFVEQQKKYVPRRPKKDEGSLFDSLYGAGLRGRETYKEGLTDLNIAARLYYKQELLDRYKLYNNPGEDIEFFSQLESTTKIHGLNKEDGRASLIRLFMLTNNGVSLDETINSGHQELWKEGSELFKTALSIHPVTDVSDDVRQDSIQFYSWMFAKSADRLLQEKMPDIDWSDPQQQLMGFNTVEALGNLISDHTQGMKTLMEQHKDEFMGAYRTDMQDPLPGAKDGESLYLSQRENLGTMELFSMCLSDSLDPAFPLEHRVAARFVVERAGEILKGVSLGEMASLITPEELRTLNFMALNVVSSQQLDPKTMEDYLNGANKVCPIDTDKLDAEMKAAAREASRKKVDFSTIEAEEGRAAGKQEGSKRQKVSAPEKESGPKEKQPIPKSPSL